MFWCNPLLESLNELQSKTRLAWSGPTAPPEVRSSRSAQWRETRSCCSWCERVRDCALGRSLATKLSAAQLVLCQLEIPFAAVEALLRLSADKGARVILDPAPASTLGSETLSLRKSSPRTRPNARSCSIAKATRHERCAATGSTRAAACTQNRCSHSPSSSGRPAAASCPTVMSRSPSRPIRSRRWTRQPQETHSTPESSRPGRRVWTCARGRVRKRRCRGLGHPARSPALRPRRGRRSNAC